VEGRHVRSASLGARHPGDEEDRGDAGRLCGDPGGLPVVFVRPSAIWGPGGRRTSFVSALPELVHAAAHADGSSRTYSKQLFADDVADLCYVKDCARAIAAIQLAPTLNHTVYNIGGGRAVSNAELLTSVQREAPDFAIHLSAGTSTELPEHAYMDLERLRQDTGYEPSYGLDDGIADYITWLRDGHEL
jgi:UDP-glucose 4-epimerase